MELGLDRDATRYRRWRNVYFAGTVVFGMVTVMDLAGTGYGLSDSDYVFGDGELPAEIAIFAGGTALTAACAFLAWRHARRRAEQVGPAGSGLWLPPLTDRDGDGQVDLGVETARLRPLAVRALALLVLWLALLAGGLVGFAALSASADRLLATGTHVTGRVLDAYHPRRGSSTIYVEYPVGQDWKFAEISWESDRAYVPGQAITVVYDPADPTRVRTPDETNDDQFWSWVCGIGALGALGGIPFSALAAVNWRRRYRAVRRTGWRIASVTVVPDYPVRKNRHMPDIHVEYRDGSRIMLRAAQSSHGSVPLKKQPNRLAWIGGTDQDIVVLFPHGRWRTPPYAVPAYPLTAREPQPRSPVT